MLAAYRRTLKKTVPKSYENTSVIGNRLSTFALLVVLATPAPALSQSVEDGLTAFETRNYADAYRILLPFAIGADAAARHALGDLYLRGRGVEQDVEEGARWTTLAAEQGHVQAQYELGLLYAGGRGVEQDDEEAARWYMRAAEQGHARAQYTIGERYIEGRGVDRDLAEAHRWLSLSAEQGEPFAQDALANPVFGRLPRDTDGIAGSYGGSYLCKDGEHGVYLELINVIPSPYSESEKRVWGMLGFFPIIAGQNGGLADMAGSFNIYGFIEEGGKISLRPREWLVEPEGYGAAHIEGEIDRREDGAWRITGTALTGVPDYCSDLIAMQFLP